MMTQVVGILKILAIIYCRSVALMQISIGYNWLLKRAKSFLSCRAICVVSVMGCHTIAAEASLESYCLGNAYESCFYYFDGIIESGLVTELTPLVEGSDAPTIYLNSPGGNLQEAIEVGRLIRQSGMSTAIGHLDPSNMDEFGRPLGFPQKGICESACAYMFMGGTERSLENGRLGLHRFYSNERGLSSDEAQFLSGMLVEYLVEMGVDARIFLAASRESASGMYYLSKEEGLEYDVITPSGYDDLFLEPYAGGIIAAARRLDPTRPYDHVDQVTFFCRSGQPFILLHAVSGFISQSKILGAHLGHWSDNVEIPAQSIAVRDSGDESWLTIPLPANARKYIDEKINNGTFAVWVQYPRASGGSYGVSLDLSPMDQKMIRSAFTHCIN